MNVDKDYALALQLQEQYDRMNENKKPPEKYKSITPVKSKDGTNLGSPTWELADPTPNVHALFMQFDRTFFWNKLASVVVRWSKRMYSCAGICRYQGKGGFCDIALSEPLLKLRPRKDLVETLLHEMIHAYLFLTNNDRDRDGHGPNFLQHMHRINKAANINISVYHTFIDEVRLYQTHWWRCNGPCQKQRPFFGMVRRSSNRAPGPSDFWWEGHRRNCSGTFIKIKEPEKKANPSKAIKDVTNVPDIRNYISSKGSPSTLNDKRNSTGSVSIENKTTFFPKHHPKKSLGNYSSASSSTIVITNNSTKSIQNVTLPNSLNQTTDRKKSSISELPSDELRNTVRNHWASKYSNTNKRPNETEIDNVRPSKIRRSETATCSNTDVPNNKPPTVTLNPKSLSLYYSLPTDMIKDCNKILSDLYGEGFTLESSDFKSSSVGSDKWNKASKIQKMGLNKCPMCAKSVSESMMDDHIKECIRNYDFEDKNDLLDTSSSHVIDLTHIAANKPPNRIKTSSTSIIDLTEADSKDPCSSSSINKVYTPSKMNLSGLHLDDDSVLEVSLTDSSSPIKLEPNILPDDYCNCPVCNKLISRNDASDHLEECVSKTFADDFFNTSNDFKGTQDNNDASSVHSDDIDESLEYNSNGTKVTCPCCYFLFEESQINTHLDTCLL